MKKTLSLLLAAVLVCMCFSAMAAETSAYPDGGWLVNLSNNSTDGASTFSVFAVNPNNPDQIASAWRIYGLPTNTKAGIGEWVGDFHLSVSNDGGRTFDVIDMMQYVRAVQNVDGLPSEPEYQMWWCNGPWVTYGADGTLYCGAICYTALDKGDPEHPRQGRALVFASSDNGKTFNEDATFGMRLSNFADDALSVAVSASKPSTTGIPEGERGTDPWHTPWDGNFGIASATTDMFVSSCWANVVVSHDGAVTYEKVHSIKFPEGWKCTVGTLDCGAIAVDGNTIIAPIIVESTPNNEVEPGSLGVVTSTDDGVTWSEPMIAATPADIQTSPKTRAIRYPIVAASPAEPGHWAIGVYSQDQLHAKVCYTEDAGATWKIAETPFIEGYDDYTEARGVCVGYTTDGQLVTAFRGHTTWANYYVFAALLGEDGQFSKTVLAAPTISTYPYETTQGNYNGKNGTGNNHEWVGGSSEYCYVNFSYSADGVALDQYFSAIPLDAMK